MVMKGEDLSSDRGDDLTLWVDDESLSLKKTPELIPDGIFEIAV